MKTRNLRIMFAALAFAFVTSFTSSSAATAVDFGSGEPPLSVRVASVDGRPNIKVARRLDVLISCSNDCRAVVRFILKTPTNTLRVGNSSQLPAAAKWTPGIRLNDYGLGYLKQSYRRSVLRVVVTAIDKATRKKVVRTRDFRFYR